jgi:hypothetical protein
MSNLYEEILSINDYEEFKQLIINTNNEDLMKEFYNSNMTYISFDRNRNPLYFQEEYKLAFLNKWRDYLITFTK